jgi:hypothetical protein
MANEGEFPKSDGDIDYASEGNKFNYFSVNALEGTTNLIWNGIYEDTFPTTLSDLNFGSGATMPSHFDVFSGTSYEDGTATTMVAGSTLGLNVGNDSYYYNAGSEIDRMNGVVIDTDLWATTGSVWQSGGYIRIESDDNFESNAILNGSNAPNLNSNGASLFLVYDANSNTSAGHPELRLIDESANQVTFVTSSGTQNDVMLKFTIDTSSDYVTAYKYENVRNVTNITTIGSTDISSLTDGDAWSLKLYSNRGTGGAAEYINLYYVSDIAQKKDLVYQNTAITFAGSYSIATNLINVFGASGTPVIEVSMDSGANFTTCLNKELATIGTPGSQLIQKVTITNPVGSVAVFGETAVWLN